MLPTFILRKLVRNEYPNAVLRKDVMYKNGGYYVFVRERGRINRRAYEDAWSIGEGATPRAAWNRAWRHVRNRGA